MKRQFLYPANMKAKPKLWLWSVRDVIVVGIALIPSVLAAVGLGVLCPGRRNGGLCVSVNPIGGPVGA